MHPELRRLVADEGVPVAAETIELPPERFRRARESVSEDSFGAGAVVHDGGRAVLVRNAWSDGWIYPGGTVEPGESPEAAVRREVREETGLEVTVERLLRVVEQTFRVADGGGSASGDDGGAADGVDGATDDAGGVRQPAAGGAADGEPSDSFGNHFAMYEATPTASDPTLAADPGEDGEGIQEVAWHHSAPEDIQQAAVLARFVDD
jgi:8-oxo-dGTP diphosphatase